jgi:hypothetical protein
MAMFKTFPLQHRSAGPDAPIALWRCLKPFPYSTGPKGLMTAVYSFQVFALQKPTAQKWHGGHFWEDQIVQRFGPHAHWFG